MSPRFIVARTIYEQLAASCSTDTFRIRRDGTGKSSASGMLAPETTAFVSDSADPVSTADAMVFISNMISLEGESRCRKHEWNTSADKRYAPEAEVRHYRMLIDSVNACPCKGLTRLGEPEMNSHHGKAMTRLAVWWFHNSPTTTT
jgi:hypothetical protein